MASTKISDEENIFQIGFQKQSKKASIDAAKETDVGATPDTKHPLQLSSPEAIARHTIFTQWEKRFIVLGAAISAIFSPLTVQIYLPALNDLANEFHVSVSKLNLTITTYLIFQGITPMFISGFADTMGRRPAYIICFVIYVAANIGLAVSKSYASIMVVRCLQAIGISSTQSLCQAVVTDVTTSAERGQFIAIITLPAVLGPSLGPLAGGILTEYLGWRSIFWFLSICGCVTLISMAAFFPETCRQLVGDGSIRPPKANETLWQLIKDRYRPRDSNSIVFSIERPENKSRFGAQQLFASLVLLRNLELSLVLLYGGLIFGGIQSIGTALPSQLAAVYGFKSFKIGLMFLPMVGGSVIAVALVGWAVNWNYSRHAKKLGLTVDKSRQLDLSNFPIEQARLEVAMPFLFLTCMVMLSWGWALERRTTVAVLCLLGFFLGVGFIGVTNVVNTLIADMYRKQAASAVAANWLVRCLIGAIMTAFIEPLILAVGVGWAFTAIGLTYVGFSLVLFYVMRNGMRWRQERRVKEDQKQTTAL